MNLHTVTLSITIFILAITAADVLTNRLVTPKNKREILSVCIFVFISSICEYIGAITNGAAPEWAALHRAAKITEFCAAPCISVAAANAYGELVYKKTAVGILAAHAVFEIIAFFNGWVFRVDENNVYHRQELYWVYVAAFILSIICCYICIIRGNRKYQIRFGITNALILLFLSFGIGIQMIYSDIAVDFMCVAMGSFFQYHYRGNVVNQVDVTTRLLNRRCYERRLKNMKSQAYVLIFDIDRFKLINDTYGHNEGDKCLKNVAGIIFSTYGKYGFCYRIGGDEFCVIMYKNMDKIRTLNRNFNDAVNNISGGKISGVSLGYAYYDERETTIDAAVKKADEMMYRNKMKRH